MTTSPKERLLLWVDEQHQLDPRRKLILLKLAMYADADGRAWAKVATLAAGSNSKERIVQLRLRDMEADGLLSRTGEEHTLNPGSSHPRKVPVYQLAPGVEGIDPACVSGAKFAPQGEGSGATGDTLGCKGIAPRNEPTEPKSSSEDGAGAREREALFGDLEAAFPKRGLGYTNRDRAWREFSELLDGGLPGRGLVEAARAYAADKSVKRLDLGLDHWLHDRKFRGWWAEAAEVVAAPAPCFDPPAEVREAILAVKDEAWLHTWLSQAVFTTDLGDGGVITCRLDFQAAEVRRAVGRQLAERGVTIEGPSRATASSSMGNS